MPVDDDFKVHTRRVVVFVTISKLLSKAYCIVENFSMGFKIGQNSQIQFHQSFTFVHEAIVYILDQLK